MAGNQGTFAEPCWAYSFVGIWRRELDTVVARSDSDAKVRHTFRTEAALSSRRIGMAKQDGES